MAAPWQGREAKFKSNPLGKNKRNNQMDSEHDNNCPLCKAFGEVKMDDQFIKPGEHFISAPNPYKFAVGDVVEPMSPEDRKNWGDVIAVVEEIHEERKSQPFPWMEATYYDGTVRVVSDKRPDGPKARFRSKDFEKVSREKFDAQLKKVSETLLVLSKENYKTGDPVQLTTDIDVWQEGHFSCGYVTVRRGTSAIIDLAPEANEDEDYENKRSRERNAVADLTLYTCFGTYKLEQLLVPRLQIFLPEMEEFTWVGVTQIKRKLPELADTKLIVPDGYMERLITATKRVTNVDIHDRVYEQLGLNRVCQKGRGAIMLLYGPPGTGKTLTAEIMAERIGRPIIKLTLGSLTDGEGLAQRLATGFQRAKRYNAVLLLDEVDVFIRRRGGSNPIFDENTSVFLRVLEYFDGILVMTTNLVDHIDPAIFSRVHVCLEYGSVTPEERKAIWKSMFPKELLDVLAGDEDAHEKMFDALSTVKINGREIKNVIQNVVCRAVVATETKDKKGLEAIPENAKWISPKSFVDEAKALEEQRNMLKGSDGGMF